VARNSASIAFAAALPDSVSRRSGIGSNRVRTLSNPGIAAVAATARLLTSSSL